MAQVILVFRLLRLPLSSAATDPHYPVSPQPISVFSSALHVGQVYGCTSAGWVRYRGFSLDAKDTQSPLLPCGRNAGNILLIPSLHSKLTRSMSIATSSIVGELNLLQPSRRDKINGRIHKFNRCYDEIVVRLIFFFISFANFTQIQIVQLNFSFLNILDRLL